MFGSILWQNSSSSCSTKNSKAFEDSSIFNNFEHYGNSNIKSAQNSVNNIDDFQTNKNLMYHLNSSNTKSNNFISTTSATLFECNYNYDFYQANSSRNTISDSQKAVTAYLCDNSVSKKSKKQQQQQIKQNPYIDQSFIHSQIKANFKQDKFEINTSISNSIKALMKQRRFSIRQRQVANQRERDRTHSVNSAFLLLRSMIPTDPVDRKLSKIETLRLAGSYISHLNTILNAPLEYANDKPCLNKFK